MIRQSQSESEPMPMFSWMVTILFNVGTSLTFILHGTFYINNFNVRDYVRSMDFLHLNAVMY